MNIVLWILQILTAAVFGMAGYMKAFTPEEKLLEDERTAWVKDAGIQRARIAGYAELAGAAGMILPGLVGVLEILTPLAGLGLVTVMALAAFTVHRPREEQQIMMINGALALLPSIVAIGRLIEPL